MSCGQLGCLHLLGMDAVSYRRAFSDIFGRLGQARSLVVDIRDNTGCKSTTISRRCCPARPPVRRAAGRRSGGGDRHSGVVGGVSPHPGLTYGVPQLPHRRVDGTLSENHEVEPTIAVPSDPGAWARGRDPQLEAAV